MPVKIFFCYAREDETLLNKLKTHLRPLQRQGLIDVWHDRDINAGAEWEREISEHLNTSQVILLLVSPDFLNSDYCYGVEMQRAMERHERGEARVIPIILRWALWRETPIGKLQALPKAGRPIMDRGRRTLDYALCDVAEGIREVLTSIQLPDRVERVVEEAKQLVENKFTHELPAEYEKQIQQQVVGMLDFRQAIDAHDWKQAEKVLQKYPNLPEARSLLGLSMSKEVQEYFSDQLHPGNSLQALESLGGPVTPMYGSMSSPV